MPSQPKVTILMGVHNGVPHLPAQLASLARQSFDRWHLVCSDDGSVDDSRRILRKFAGDHPGKVTLLAGPQRGFSANYMGLIRQLPQDPGHVAFCDQDDVWLPDKLACAMDALTGAQGQPVLYAGRHLIWQGARRRASAVQRHPCTLRNALAENIASGNTIVLAPAAAALAREAARRTGPVFAHDWWLYLLITACGGQVHFDNGPPKILYRQHGQNAIGAGATLGAQVQRKLGVLRGSFAQRVDGNLTALMAVADLLTPQARMMISEVIAARQQRGVARLVALSRLRLYRQSWPGHIGFWGAASLGRI